MKKLRRTLCKIFGHKWEYYFTVIGGRQDLRACTRCHQVERYEQSFPFKAWLGTVQYTKKGAKDNLGERYEEK